VEFLAVPQSLLLLHMMIVVVVVEDVVVVVDVEDVEDVDSDVVVDGVSVVVVLVSVVDVAVPSAGFLSLSMRLLNHICGSALGASSSAHIILSDTSLPLGHT